LFQTCREVCIFIVVTASSSLSLSLSSLSVHRPVPFTQEHTQLSFHFLRHPVSTSQVVEVFGMSSFLRGVHDISFSCHLPPILIIFSSFETVQLLTLYFASNAHNVQERRVIKTFLNKKAAPTCFGLQGNHHRGATAST